MDLQEIQDQLDLNTSIQEDIKNMVKEVYSDIYSFLGERQFKKWLIDSHIKSIARRTIYQSLTEKEDDYLKENKTVLGYRTIASENRDKIVLRKHAGDNKSTTAHETFHAIVDGWGGFNSFFGEGLTEFLNKNLYNSKDYSYKDNVDVVSLVYSMYSDKLIKYFLTQRGDIFFFDLTRNIDEYSANIMQNRNIEIEEQFKKFHEIIYGKNKINYTEANEHLKDGINLLMTNYYVYIKARINKLEYIKDGYVDINGFTDEIAKVYGTYKKLSPEAWEYKDLINFLTIELVENSHLLEGTGEERAKTRQDICQKINEAIEVKSAKYSVGLNAQGIRDISQDEEPYISLNTNLEEKLINKLIISSSEELNFVDKIKRLGNIQKALGLSQEKVAEILEECKVNEQGELAEKFTSRYSRTILNINDIEKKHNSNYSTPRYVQAELKCMPKNRVYFEGTEIGKLSMIVINNESGEVSHIDFDRYGEILSENGILVRQCNNIDEDKKKNIPGEFKYYQNVFEIYSMESKESAFVGFNNFLNPLRIADGNSVKIVNGKIDRETKFLENIKEETLSEMVFESIADKIEEEQYSSNEKDMNMKTMFYDNFIEEYNSIKEKFPGIDKNEEELGYLTERLVDKTFKIDSLPYTNFNGINESVKMLYESKKEKMKTNFKELARAKRVGENTEHVLYLRGVINNEVYDVNTILNSAREQTEIFNKCQDNPKEQFLQSVIDRTKKVTRTSTIQSQIEQIQLLAKKTKEKNIEAEKSER